MSLVENLINQISSQGSGSIIKPQGFDLQDDTFAKLLEQQAENLSGISQSNIIGNLGVPAGLMIEPLNGTDFAEMAQDQLESIGENKLINAKDDVFVMKDVVQDDFFTTMLKTNSDNNSEFMNFAKKNAANAYNVFSKNFVDDITEFAQDIAAAL